ncbi:MAG: hypothetical protein HY699_19630 [Deltaproteobacteria bacterium]|nr:hypothetical protein [Deltaproteobacteria bacterium]
MIVRLFNDVPDECFGTDANDDGFFTAADLSALPQLLVPPPPTPPSPQGPAITFFGLATASGRLAAALGEIEPGLPVFYRVTGTGFKVVIEGAPGLAESPLGLGVLEHDPNDPARRPDLQIESNRPLGDGHLAVCDERGVPGVDPPDFGPAQTIADALNDFACGFTVATSPRAACVEDEFGLTGFAGRGTTAQFCLAVGSQLRFPDGDTQLTVQLRDAAGNLGAPARLIVRVDGGPIPLPFTATLTATATLPRPTRTPTRSRTPTPTITSTPAATATRTPSATRTGTSTLTRTPSVTRTPTRQLSPTPTPTGPPTRTFTLTATPTVTLTATRTSTPTRSGTRTPTPTRTASPTPTLTPTATVTPTPTSSPTPTTAPGPIVTFFGLASAADNLLEPVEEIDGVPVYRPTGLGFQIVVEGGLGPAGRQLGQSAFADDPDQRPDLQIVPSQALGNGSTTVCDNSPPAAGGVPAVDPPRFDDELDITHVMNDLGCRFDNGSGKALARTSPCDACVQFDGEAGFVDRRSHAQFCARISQYLALAPGDTLFVARLRDQAGNLGEPAKMIVRIDSPSAAPATTPAPAALPATAPRLCGTPLAGAAARPQLHY